MNVSRRDGIRWPPGLTVAPLRTATRGQELRPVCILSCVFVFVCVRTFTLAATLLYSAANRFCLCFSAECIII